MMDFTQITLNGKAKEFVPGTSTYWAQLGAPLFALLHLFFHKRLDHQNSYDNNGRKDIAQKMVNDQTFTVALQIKESFYL